MKVYILYKYEPYESPTISGIYKSKEKAELQMEKNNAKESYGVVEEELIE